MHPKRLSRAPQGLSPLLLLSPHNSNFRSWLLSHPPLQAILSQKMRRRAQPRITFAAFCEMLAQRPWRAMLPAPKVRLRPLIRPSAGGHGLGVALRPLQQALWCNVMLGLGRRRISCAPQGRWHESCSARRGLIHPYTCSARRGLWGVCRCLGAVGCCWDAAG